MTNSALNRTTIVQLTNKSGSALEQGSVVIVDVDNNKAFDTTTTQDYTTTNVGVVFEPFGIDNNDVGAVALAGWIPLILTSGTVVRGDKLRTASTAGLCYASALSDAGDFAEALESGDNPEAFLFGSVAQAIGAGTIADNTYTEYDASSGDKDVFNETIPALTDGIIKTLSWGTLVNNNVSARNITLKLVIDAETITGPTISVPGGASDARNWTLETIIQESSAAAPGFPLAVLLTFTMQIDDTSDPTTTFIASYYDFFSGDPDTTHTYKAQINLATTDFTLETYATVIEGPYR